MPKKKEVKEELFAPEQEKPVKKQQPKIHLDKYFAIHELTFAQKARLGAIFGGEMHTESEWNEIIEKESHRRLK